jgi:hypothetical protein
MPVGRAQWSPSERMARVIREHPISQVTHRSNRSHPIHERKSTPFFSAIRRPPQSTNGMREIAKIAIRARILSGAIYDRQRNSDTLIQQMKHFHPILRRNLSHRPQQPLYFFFRVVVH